MLLFWRHLQQLFLSLSFVVSVPDKFLESKSATRRDIPKRFFPLGKSFLSSKHWAPDRPHSGSPPFFIWRGSVFTESKAQSGHLIEWSLSRLVRRTELAQFLGTVSPSASSSCVTWASEFSEIWHKCYDSKVARRISLGQSGVLSLAQFYQTYCFWFMAILFDTGKKITVALADIRFEYGTIWPAIQLICPV